MWCKQLTKFSSLRIKKNIFLRDFSTSCDGKNPNKKIVIIGGVAGGASASARLRRNCEKCNIVMFERGNFVSFANCGLPYYVGNIIQDEQKLLSSSPSLFKNRFNIDVRLHCNITKIDRNNKKITVNEWNASNNTIKTYEESYDKLILAVGAKPITPPIEGINFKGVFSVRSIEDSRDIRKYIDELPKDRKKCCIVGGGFIGLEMAENMKHRGFNVTLMDALPQVMGTIDYEMIVPIHQTLIKNNIQLELNQMLSKITTNENDSSTSSLYYVHTKSGKKIEADIIILGLGVTPESQLAKDCGLTLGVKNSIVVNKNMETSDPNIYAVGDVIETYNYISGKKMNLALAGPAQQQARLVADLITNIESKDNKYGQYRGVQASAVCGIFDSIIASTGLNIKYIEQFMPEINMKQDVSCIYAHPGHHADFYPNVQQMHLKVIFNNKTGQIYGASCYGKNNDVVKYIDIISTYIQMKANIEDLAYAELCYAPQFASARGPINIMGQIGLNVRKGLIKIFDWNELNNINNNVQNKHIILDVRNDDEVEKDTIKHKNVKVINVKLNDLRNNYQKYLNDDDYLNKQIPINCMCYVGKRGYVAARFLQHLGYNSYLMSGGMITYHMINNSQSFIDY